MNPPGEIHVLVVDDSAVVREVVTQLLQSDGGFKVTAASDPLLAMSKIAVRRPDVILLDLEMPRMDGLTFLQRLMAEDPLPVVVCSALTGKGTEAAMRALELGAVDIVTKPKVGVRGFLNESKVLLSEALRAAAGVRRTPRRLLPAPPPLAAAVRPPSAPKHRNLRETTDKVIALGASTGGTEALRELLLALPPDSPGVVIVQHMPEGFTAAFAQSLDNVCKVEVKEAADGDRVREGRVLIAPGNKHMELGRSGAQYMVRVFEGPLVSRHRPSVDVLFRSVAEAAGPNAVGAILTGMGNDGAEGLLAMKQAGAATIAQDEESCVVFGMPNEAIKCGAVDVVLPLSRIASTALRLARQAPAIPAPGGPGRG